MAVELSLEEIYTFNGAMNDPISEGAKEGRGILESGSRGLAYYTGGGELRYSVDVTPHPAGFVEVHLSKDWIEDDDMGFEEAVQVEWSRNLRFKSSSIAQEEFQNQVIYGQLEQWMARGLGAVAGLDLLDRKKSLSQKSAEIAVLGTTAAALYLRGDFRIGNYRHFAHLMWPAVYDLDTKPDWVSYPTTR